MMLPPLHPARALVISAAALSVVVFALTFILGGARGIAYLAALVAITVPGWPVGHALFGKRHAAAWIGGGLIGYALSAFAIWAVIAAGRASFVGFGLAWTVVTAAVWLSLGRRRSPLIQLPVWRKRDTCALLLTLLLVPALFWRPYSRLGHEDQQGNRYYRAYFTADFLWHMALTSEVSKFAMPPRNPFLLNEPIHYYWTYFLVPAAAVGSVPGLETELEPCLKITALFCGLLSVAMLFVAAWCAVPDGRAVAAAVVVALVASSVEGLYAMYEQFSRGRPLSGVKELNIRAMANWRFGGLRVDGLTRLLWYNPQHSMAGALALISVPVAGAGGVTPLAAVLVGLALGCALTFNPFIGGMFALIFGMVELVSVLRRPSELPRRIAVSGLAAIPVALALFWCIHNVMLEGAGGAIELGFLGDARRAPLQTLLLSSGPLLLLALAGLWPRTRLSRSLWPAVIGAGLSLGMMYFVRLSVDAAWVGFRASQALHLLLTILAAHFLRNLPRGWMVGAVVAATLAVGLPTTLIDAFNAQDITNFNRSPGRFRWTVPITRQEREALTWVRKQTPATAIVQMDPVAHGRETWSLIPSFAQRRMAAGNAIPLLHVPEYDTRSAEIHALYRENDPARAWDMAQRLGIDYLYVGTAEREGLPRRALAKFDAKPALFLPVFANEQASVFEVRRGPPR